MISSHPSSSLAPQSSTLNDDEHEQEVSNNTEQIPTLSMSNDDNDDDEIDREDNDNNNDFNEETGQYLHYKIEQELNDSLMQTDQTARGN